MLTQWMEPGGASFVPVRKHKTHRGAEHVTSTPWPVHLELKRGATLLYWSRAVSCNFSSISLASHVLFKSVVARLITATYFNMPPMPSNAGGGGMRGPSTFDKCVCFQ